MRVVERVIWATEPSGAVDGVGGRRGRGSVVVWVVGMGSGVVSVVVYAAAAAAADGGCASSSFLASFSCLGADGGGGEPGATPLATKGADAGGAGMDVVRVTGTSLVVTRVLIAFPALERVVVHTVVLVVMIVLATALSFGFSGAFSCFLLSLSTAAGGVYVGTAELELTTEVMASLLTVVCVDTAFPAEEMVEVRVVLVV